MELGGLEGELSWRSLVDEAFTGTGYKLTYFNDMNTWLKS